MEKINLEKEPVNGDKPIVKTWTPAVLFALKIILIAGLCFALFGPSYIEEWIRITIGISCWMGIYHLPNSSD